jgi:anti-anti-sigma factor
MLNDDEPVYAPSGRIDGHNAAVAEKDLLAQIEKTGPHCVIDLSGLSFLSSAGLRVLLVGVKACRAQGGSVVLAGPTAPVLDILKMSGFDKIMPLATDRSAALQQLASVRPRSAG